MDTVKIIVSILAAIAVIGTAAPAARGADVGTAITFQGELIDGGIPVSGDCDFEFSLWDMLALGSQIGPTLTPTVTVISGRFIAVLDFGENIFYGEARWLEIKVCCPAPCSPAFTPLAPRLELTPATRVIGGVGPPSGINVGPPGGNNAGSATGNTTYVSVGIGCTPPILEKMQVDGDIKVIGSVIAEGSSASDIHGVVGPVNTIVLDPTANTLTTSSPSDEPFEVMVGGERAMCLTPPLTDGGATSPNVILGFSSNTVEPGIVGATISGGGQSGTARNKVSGFFGTIGGGQSNDASGDYGTVGGGLSNAAIGLRSTVGGGNGNDAIGNWATVGGGRVNRASGSYATVPGGRDNWAVGDYSFAAGHRARADHHGTFVWSDNTTVDPDFFASTGVNQFLINADGGVGIGTDSPSEALHVVGNICATGTIGACSDRRYKQKIEPIGDPLNTLSRLRGVRFDWKRQAFPDRKFSAQRQVGFVAQELAEVLPEVVSRGRAGFYSVDYGRVVPLLVEAVKELRAEMNGRDTLIAKQSRGLSALEARLGELERAVRTRAPDRSAASVTLPLGPAAREGGTQ